MSLWVSCNLDYTVALGHHPGGGGAVLCYGGGLGGHRQRPGKDDGSLRLPHGVGARLSCQLLPPSVLTRRRCRTSRAFLPRPVSQNILPRGRGGSWPSSLPRSMREVAALVLLLPFPVQLSNHPVLYWEPLFISQWDLPKAQICHSSPLLKTLLWLPSPYALQRNRFLSLDSVSSGCCFISDHTLGHSAFCFAPFFIHMEVYGAHSRRQALSWFWRFKEQKPLPLWAWQSRKGKRPQ